ncbi:sensor histidine kinase [Martelella limonii]|uniref:sensor histidine kinase n=1 Tax=Martelella limonii TaxID=1647649 RepID=UPI0015811B24|nr:histidine kinase [Martelella limonii]
MAGATPNDRSIEGLTGAPGEQVSPQPAPLLRTFWISQVAIWGFLALVSWISRLIAFNDILLATAMTLAVEPVAFAATTALHVLFLSRCQRIASLPVILFLLCFSVAGGVLLASLADIVRRSVLGGIDLSISLPMNALFYAFLLIGWCLFYFWLSALIDARNARLRAAEARAETMRLELERLHLQLAPHFLFNALNSIASEIHDRPDDALEMVRRISSYLRYCLDQPTNACCPLTDELEAMRAYLRIQELRFEERLNCEVRVDDSAVHVLVPHMILQGLVENAVKHGLRHPDDTIEIRIEVSRLDEETILIEVRNSGALPPQPPARPTIGLNNTRKRLSLHYSDRYRLTLKQAGATVVARLELRGSACPV